MFELGPEPPGFSDSEDSDCDGVEFVGPGHSTTVMPSLASSASLPSAYGIDSCSSSSSDAGTMSSPQENSIKLQVPNASASDETASSDETDRKS